MAIEELDEESENIQPEESKDSGQDEVIQALIVRLDQLENKPLEVSSSEGPDSQERFLKAVESLAGKTAKEKYGSGYTSPEDIDPEDVLLKEDAVTFFAYKSQYIVVDDKRNGHPVRTPYLNVIKFEYESTKATKRGKDTDLITLSVYTSISKREVKWLREHSLYNSMFFDRQQSKMGQDAVYANIIAKIMKSISSQGQAQIIRLSRDRGLDMIEDIRLMRLNLANAMAEEEMAVLKNTSRGNQIFEARKDELMLATAE